MLALATLAIFSGFTVLWTASRVGERLTRWHLIAFGATSVTLGAGGFVSEFYPALISTKLFSAMLLVILFLFIARVALSLVFGFSRLISRPSKRAV
jgi:hypothetical protein